MKIGVISTGVFVVGQNNSPLSGYGGLEAIAWLQAKGLAERGHEVTLFAPEGSLCPGVTVIPICPPGQWNESVSYSQYWQHLLSFNDGGVILDHTWNKFSFMLKMEGRLQAPVLAWTHAPVNTMFQSMPPVEKPCFVCISKDQAAHFEALFSRECRVCYNGVDVDAYSPLNLPRSDRFLFLARFSAIKGADLAQDLCLATNTGLDMIGDSSITNEPEYLERCKQRSDGKQIRMIGSAPRGECVWWFSQAKALVHLNQRFREPFGLAPVEAQLCGAPVLCWNNGAMRETVKHGETGFLVKSMDEAIQLVRNGALDTINRKQCREWASQFSVQNMITKCEELCTEALQTGGW